MKDVVIMVGSTPLTVTPVTEVTKEHWPFFIHRVFPSERFQEVVWGIFAKHQLNEVLIIGENVIDETKEILFESENIPKAFIQRLLSISINNKTRRLSIEGILTNTPKRTLYSKEWTDIFVFNYSIGKDKEGKILSFDDFIIQKTL
jgi:hypothetical protein